MILRVGPFLAGSAALIALIVSATTTARLRRQEELLREAADSTEPPHRAALDDLHRWVLARILARQVCGWWRFTWPWLVWAGMVAVSAQSSYLLAERLSRSQPTPPSEVLGVFTGDHGPFAIMAVVIWPILFMPVFTSLEWSLTQRASIIRRFYLTGTVYRPEPFREWGNFPRGSTQWRTVGKTLRAMMPAFAAFSAGVFLGSAVFRRLHPDVVPQDHPGLMNLSGWAIFAMAFAITAVMIIVSSVALDVEDAASEPSTHPPSAFVLPRRRLRRPRRENRLTTNERESD
ncbi:hypothetical protein VZC37_19615 [Gordonia sp. LSe1-13]|uniref:DUF4328 domain-containing protein n=1 Tax=Gordonia sesuvii TaxID=3116777 RepID=A0ABU7MHI5_9ACTN|nr:hypothetical protein [Gordonia sp. LSe1-13]